ncbi:UDP-2,3-diacylglucosamine diphosphatase [Pseudomaricurvus sp. HS19]|uniref:UDP-2,3-diacylglucosamine diphosphatase n=1 Tax=Pseudomaricurvus sp. HS19 TaxID=2692626 RepID=UPI0013680527|nr:UDP-2,3-diacylglucosamine diphosphatase [Pseudomaricurvus sp. HS19]MYM65037.1 UDP-2,3-diacylglucosamine diphosphatase [Pseudomaricurvus sp. HS19]
MNHHYRTLWISDVHLGTRDCQAEQLDNLLRQVQCDTLYLVGDIIDGWKMSKGIYWRPEFSRVIRRLLNLSRQGVTIRYITGNHDECLRRFANSQLDNIYLCNRFEHHTADGRRLLVIHGDQFDTVTRCHHLLKFFGDKGYDLLMYSNRVLNDIRSRYGYGYWSLAGYLKSRIGKAQAYINDYEESVAYAAQRMGYDGVVCGHIHRAAIRRIGDVEYFNTGDWVESCSALAEDADGNICLLDGRQLTAAPEVAEEEQEELDSIGADLAARIALPLADNAPANDPLRYIPPLIIPGKL